MKPRPQRETVGGVLDYLIDVEKFSGPTVANDNGLPAQGRAA